MRMRRAAGRPSLHALRIPETVSAKEMHLPIAIRLWMNGQLQVFDAQGSLVPSLSGPWTLCIPVLLTTIPYAWVDEWTVGVFGSWMQPVSRSQVHALNISLESTSDTNRGG